jgi:hypothetical protein
MATAHAIRRWSLDHPHEHLLLYGSPVPGYAAPDDTIGPATRVDVRAGRHRRTHRPPDGSLATTGPPAAT